MANQILVIAPYWLDSVEAWVFDDTEPAKATRTNGRIPTSRFKLVGTRIVLISEGLGSCLIRVGSVPKSPRNQRRSSGQMVGRVSASFQDLY
jgi:hypothetical protein